jgi:exonuclease SbcC
MKILSVTLVNFRSHENLTVEFDSGVNLLIGQNGAGKSSILEAIGLALFDGSLRSTNSAAVRYGEKSGVVSVVFVGVDVNTYRVDRKIGSGAHWKLFLGDEKAARFQGAEDLKRELRKITGISKNEKQVFADVVCAVQNRFTDIFSQSESKREESFNLLFDTDIYRNIYKKFVGDNSVTQRYTQQSDNLSGQILNLSENMVDEKAIKDELNESTIKKEKQLEELKVVELKIVERDETVKKVAVEIGEYKSLQEKSDSLNSELATLRESITHSEKLIRDSGAAKRVVEENVDGFKRYESLKTEQDNLEKKIAHEAEVRDSEKLLLQQKSALISSKANSEQRVAVLNSEIKSDEEREELLRKEIAELQSQIEKIGKEQETVLSDGKKLKEITDRYKLLLDDKTACEKESELLSRELSSLKYDPAETDLLKIEIDKQTLKIEKLTAKNEELRVVNQHISVENSKRSELESAEHELSKGTCPLLKERCQNMENSNGERGYFEHRYGELNFQISILNNKRVDLENAPEELRVALKEQFDIKSRLEQSEQKKVDITRLNERIGFEAEKSGLVTEKLSLVESSFEVVDGAYTNRYEALILEKEGLQNRFVYFREEIGKLSDSVKASSNYLSEVTGFISLKNKEFGNLKIGLDEFSGNLNNLTSQIEINQKLIIEIETVRSEIRLLTEKLVEVSTAHKLVVESRTLADKLDEFTSQKEKSESTLQTNQGSLDIIAKRLAERNVEKLSSELEKNEIELLGFRKVRDEYKENVTKTGALIETLQLKLKNAESQSNKLKQLDLDQLKINRKLELTSLFRNNLNDMGRFVATSFVENIGRDATDHFQKITGQNDNIEWVVNEKEKYTVYLTSGIGDTLIRREFLVLSGGEQVAVALALRTAMAQELAGGEFAIFDEPTINLDSERKVALAESIKSMLGTLEQTIIVTHDDVFREMAQKVVEL